MPGVTLNLSALSIQATETYIGAIVQDTFTDTTGTHLEAHTMDSGTAWTPNGANGSAYCAITGADRVRNGSVAITGYTCSLAPASADQSVQADLVPVGPSSHDKFAGVAARFSAMDISGYSAGFNYQDSAWEIYSWTSGTRGSIASSAASLTNGTTYTILFALSGTSLKLYVDGSLTISTTDSTYSATGLVGVLFQTGNIGDTDSSGMHLDNWQMVGSGLIQESICPLAGLTASSACGAIAETILISLAALSATDGAGGISGLASLAFAGLSLSATSGGEGVSVIVAFAGLSATDALGTLVAPSGGGSITIDLSGLSISDDAGGETAQASLGVDGLFMEDLPSNYSAYIGSSIIVGLSALQITEAPGTAVYQASINLDGLEIADYIAALVAQVGSSVSIDLSGLSITDHVGADATKTIIGLVGLLVSEVLQGLIGIRYHVYGNSGTNDPIDYSVALVSTDGLTWTSGPLAHPGVWKFGVRAFSVGDNLEERNIDAVVTIQLDATGIDITKLPAPLLNLTGHASKNGSIILDWTYQLRNALKRPTGFHVYQGSGGPPNYSAPVKVVPYAQGLTWFTATITGLTDGVSYTFGVRAYNATAEEQNTTSVTVTADATGPAAVINLTGTSVP